MFTTDRFVEDCRQALDDGQEAVREVVTAAVSDSARIVRELGEPSPKPASSPYTDPRP